MPDEKNAVTDRFNFMHKKSLLKLTTYLDLKNIKCYTRILQKKYFGSIKNTVLKLY